MKISKMIPIFDVCQKANRAVRMEGLHGIGKSGIVVQWTKLRDIHLETLFLSQMEQGDLIGIPYNKDGDAIEDYDGSQQVMYWSKPSWLVRMEKAHQDGKHCALFLDELSRATLDVRQSSLQIVLEGKIHEHHLPRINGIKTAVIAADNPAKLYQTDELDPALLDRFSTFDVEHDVNGWLAWGREQKLESVITDFIAEYPTKLHFMNNVDKGATPRSWEGVSDILKNIGQHTNFILPLINSTIGETVGASFYHFYNNYSKVIKVDDLIAMVDAANKKNEDISGQVKQEEIAKKIREVTKEIESISASELAEKIKDKIEGGQDINDYLMIYLASLNGEIMSSILKGWKNENATWFYQFMGKVPQQYLTGRMLAAASK